VDDQWMFCIDPDAGQLELALESQCRHGIAIEQAGRVRFRSTPSLLFKWLVPRLHLFQAGYPDIRVETFAEESLLRTEPRDFDLAIDYSFGEYRDLVAVPLLAKTCFRWPVPTMQRDATGRIPPVGRT